MNYKRSGEICEILKISNMTLSRWRRNGLVQYKQLSSKKILYDLDSIEGYKSEKPNNRKNVIYARVSNSKQKEDLDRQINLIKSYMISNGIIPDLIFEDIASGMNENRINLSKLVHLVTTNQVDKIYISYKDRLTRFGFDYFVNFFKEFGTEIIILNASKEEDFQEELTQDLISIIHHFSMKLYSNRRKLLKEFTKNLKSE